MKKLISVLLISCLSAAPTKVACLGDSITVHGHYVKYLSEKLSDFTFHVYAKSGASPKWMLEQITSGNLVLTNYSYLIVWGGVNEVRNASNNIRYLQAIYDKAHKANVIVIAVTIPPWKGYVTWGKSNQLCTYMINGFIMSRPSGVDYIVDAYTILEGKQDTMKREYQSDCLHPNKTGHTLIGKAIFKKIKE